jgi:predicted nuclease of predicted toxin-antitoxin system
VRFKLDENLPVELAAELRAMGYDVDTVADEGLCGEADPAVVEAASIADRVLRTLDKGIADLRSHRRAAVVLFRPDSAGRRAVLSFVRERLSTIASMDLAGRVTVVGPSRRVYRY